MADMELLPCPFCGGEAICDRMATQRRPGEYRCATCGCRMFTNEPDPVAWNRRAPSPAADIAAARRAGMLEAAWIADSMAPYTEAAIQRAASHDILDNICLVSDSRKARSIAAAIRAKAGCADA